MKDIIFMVLFITGSFAFAIAMYAIQETNILPYGRRATKKFVEKITCIAGANRVSGGCVIANRKGLIFSVKVINNDVPDGIEYKTIKMYTCRSLLINDEEVVRVHCIHRAFKDKYFLEFTSERKQDEIVEIVDASYNLAKQIYSNYISTTFHTDTKSFYTEVQQ